MIAYQTDRKGPFCTSDVNPYAVLPVVEFTNEDGQRELTRLLGEHLSENRDSINHPINKSRSEITRSMLEEPNLGSVAYFTFNSQRNIENPMELTSITTNPQAGNIITI